jgi:hypothetical protein
MAGINQLFLVPGVRAGFRVELIHLDIGSFVPVEAETVAA